MDRKINRSTRGIKRGKEEGEIKAERNENNHQSTLYVYVKCLNKTHYFFNQYMLINFKVWKNILLENEKATQKRKKTLTYEHSY